MPGRRGFGRFAFRVYSAAYVAVLGVGVLSDLSHRAGTHPMQPRSAALIALGLLAGTAIVAATGRRAVALRVSEAELQLSLLSPRPRRDTLRRTTLRSLGLCVAVCGFGGLVAVALSNGSGGGTDAALSVVCFASGIGGLAFGVHLLVAEQRGRPLTVAALAVALTLVADVVRERGRSVLTTAVRQALTGGSWLVVLVVSALASLVVWVAWQDSERLSLERIGAGSATSDGASLAVAGNDIRSLLLVTRAVGARAWRTKPLFRVSTAFALSAPATTRTLRFIARWRLSRWVTVLSTIATATVLLTSGSPSFARLALVALLLWALGLALNEPFAQEHDRRDRLRLLPQARSLELRLLGSSTCTTFIVLLPALWVRLPVATAACLATAAAAAATVASGVSFRSEWKLLLDPKLAGQPPEAIAAQMLYKLSRPGIAAAVCLTGWQAGATGVTLAAPGLLCLAALGAAILTDDFDRLRRITIGALAR